MNESLFSQTYDHQNATGPSSWQRFTTCESFTVEVACWTPYGGGSRAGPFSPSATMYCQWRVWRIVTRQVLHRNRVHESLVWSPVMRTTLHLGFGHCLSYPLSAGVDNVHVTEGGYGRTKRSARRVLGCPWRQDTYTVTPR